VKSKLGTLLLAIFILSGCSAKVRLYPVQGPLSTQTPAPVLLGKLTGAFRSGEISVVLSDGEICKGRWVQVKQAEVPKGATAATITDPDGMSPIWDSVYGAGFYTSHILGTYMFAWALASGNRGTIIHAEMYKSLGEHAEVRGVAKDDKGIVYKLVI
jgi:hypothetical protein